jgi:hypothetical protein
MEDQLNKEIEIPRKRIPWVKYFLQFLLPAFFVSYKAHAQGKVKVKTKDEKIISNCSNITKGATKFPVRDQNKRPFQPYLRKQEEKVVKETCIKTVGDTTIKWIPEKDAFMQTIQGKVIDDKGDPVPYATIVIRGTKNGVAADSVGSFAITLKSNWENITLSVSCAGYVPTETNLKKSNPTDNLEIELKQSAETLGEVVVIDTKTHRMGALTRCVTSYRTSSSIASNISKSNFKIYPNPVQSNSTLKIEWKQKDPGDHIFQIFNQSGQLIFTKEMYIDGESGSSSINIPSVLSGSYFLKITSAKTGRSYVEKLIIK